MDKKAKQILLKTFWETGGWKSGPPILEGTDFEYARSKGLMFDPLTITHDQLVTRLAQLHEQITLEQVTQTFLHSLSTRKLHLRSVLSSWALTSGLLAHTYEERKAVYANTSSCGDCNFRGLMSNHYYMDVDLNVLQFERIKWGGIRLNWLLYCWFDLEQFALEETVVASSEDQEIFQQLMVEVQACEPDDHARKLEKRWKDLLPSSKHERDVLMEICGYAGILRVSEKPRIRKGHSNSDFVAMAEWEGQDGYSTAALSYYFERTGFRE